MKVHFLGASRVVTGSCFLINTGSKKLLVDCGLFQGTKELKERNYGAFPFDPREIDLVILTHAHIDHSGLIPKLCKEGFDGKIYATKATADLCQIMLQDSGYIQEMEVERKNRKRIRAGIPLLEPIYTAEDGKNAINQFKNIKYDEVLELDEIKMRFLDAGHILGSSIVELWVQKNGQWIKLVFTGDLGNNNQPVIRDPWACQDADYLLIECTYGTREHEGRKDRREKFYNIIKKTMDAGGNLIIPAFAVGRTQDLIYELNELVAEGKIDEIPVYVDSPLAISATEIFKNNPDCFDEQSMELLTSGNNPLDFKNLTFTRTTEESMKLNELKGGAIIISASGMCDAGRIKHHLKHNLWRSECSVLMVGYQAQGTLGRRLLDGEKIVRIHGETVAVEAGIYCLDAFSAHADRTGLIEWIDKFHDKPDSVFLVHGEEQTSSAFAETIHEKLGLKCEVPYMGDVISIDKKGWRKSERTPVMGIPPEESIEELETLYETLEKGIERISKRAGFSQWLEKFNTKIEHLHKEIEEKVEEKKAAGNSNKSKANNTLCK